MTILLLLMVIIILIIIIIIQYMSRRERSNNLKYIQNKLKTIISEANSEKLLVVTDDKELRELLVVINNLLDFSQKVFADYKKKEMSMNKMLSNISHDLKTPLTVVLGYIETMKLDEDISKEDGKMLISKVHKKTHEVIDLINKFFDLAKLESGDKEVSLTRVNMNEVCRKNILDFYDNLTIKGFQVDIQIPDVTIYALGNLEALDRIMNNLISNAIKYGNDGKYIGLNLSYDDNFTYVEICDKGKGIDEINIEKVFERMYTLEDSRNRLYQGSGLGLTITKRLVNKLSGEIFLESKPYEKTSFTYKLKRIKY
ncbi:sensor histidine kinase YycG [Clostridium puniceum]|uniref:histidine kinase n=1 Tax=Clostridium puniceum TaxID=29367 RepID=A0A1S8TD16_9CLOT|nr:sensor histidine kinase [Clostridium puniceum]OOM75512.1 sensor histidine kinase YycG [Clostridium puniceum]